MKFTIGGESHEIKMASWQRSNVSPSMELIVERTMNEIKAKALALLNDLRTERGFAPVVELHGSVLLGEALCRSIEQHEDFKQEVSDAVKKYFSMDWNTHNMVSDLHRFIIPAPKPDPLVEVVHKLGWDKDTAADLRAALEARGLTITTLEKD